MQKAVETIIGKAPGFTTRKDKDAKGYQCLKAAQSMADPERKLAQFDLARRWLRLAAQIDKLDAGARYVARDALATSLARS
jgi:hypothetical protein